mgnify:CR=1 FL=1
MQTKSVGIDLIRTVGLRRIATCVLVPCAIAVGINLIRTVGLRLLSQVAEMVRHDGHGVGIDLIRTVGLRLLSPGRRSGVETL